MKWVKTIYTLASEFPGQSQLKEKTNWSLGCIHQAYQVARLASWLCDKVNVSEECDRIDTIFPNRDLILQRKIKDITLCTLSLILSLATMVPLPLSSVPPFVEGGRRRSSRRGWLLRLEIIFWRFWRFIFAVFWVFIGTAESPSPDDDTKRPQSRDKVLQRCSWLGYTAFTVRTMEVI